MLVLQRREYEKIIITCPDGVRVVISVEAIRGDRVRIGFQAPSHYTIDREEIDEAKQRDCACPPPDRPGRPTR